MDALGLTQSELARRVNVTQGAIAKIASKNPNGSAYLHKIAQVLQTSAAYLTGEIDDPTEGAPPPPLVPNIQYVSMVAALPSEDALARMFLGVLEASEGMTQIELARELAKRLPKGLAVAQGSIVSPGMAPDGDLPGPHETPPGDRSEALRASHT
jgi:transcriptional regulator with XRE-family HTH domain